MSAHYEVMPNPCVSCPYRTDIPSGVWSAVEYAKLRQFDDPLAQGLFLCHQTNATGRETVCKGWLWVHRESIGARLLELRDKIDRDARYREPGVECFASGTEAAEHGEEDIEDPSEAAREMVSKLTARGAGYLR